MSPNTEHTAVAGNPYGLSPDAIRELAGIADTGADVWGYTNAVNLREVQAKAPHLITIGPAVQYVPGHMRQPYFGAIATDAGRDFLAGLNREA